MIAASHSLIEGAEPGMYYDGLTVLRVVRVTLFLLCALLVQRQAVAKDLTLTREMLLTAEHEPAIQPRVAIRSGEGGFIIAGGSSATRRGWAAKTNAAGTVLWNYAIDLLPEDLIAFKGQLVVHPEFRGAATMTDGTTYLCGFMPRAPGSYAPGLLTHLDVDGHVLSDRLVLPQQRNELGIARFDDCVRWGDGVALIGHVSHFIKPDEKNALFPRGRAYWLLILDAAGNVKFETQLHASITNLDPEVGPLLVAADSSLFFGVTNNLDTELIHVSATGEVIAKKQLAGRFLLVRPVISDGLVQIYGARRSENRNMPLTVMMLNEQLGEINRVEGNHPEDFVVRVAYRMPDQTLALFGSAVHRFGETYTSRIAHVDARLQAEQDFDLPREKISDEGSIWAATPTQELGAFMIPTLAIARGLDLNHPERKGVLPDFMRGAALDFVRIK